MIALKTALYTHLTGGTALTALLADGTAGVYYGMADQGATLPYVTFRISSDTTVVEHPGETRTFIADIKGIDGDPHTADQIGDAIDARMKTDIGAVSGFGLFRQERDTGIEYQEVEAQNTYWHDGGRFSITVCDRTA